MLAASERQVNFLPFHDKFSDNSSQMIQHPLGSRYSATGPVH